MLYVIKASMMLLKLGVRVLNPWERLTLVTPIDKKENVKFYTEKCGFNIESTERDGNVELYRFVAER